MIAAIDERVKRELSKRELTGKESVMLMEGDIEDHVAFFEGFKELESYEEKFDYGDRSIQSTAPMQGYIDELRNAELDIGDGEAEFGYRMPLPEDRDSRERKLIIFRRENHGK